VIERLLTKLQRRFGRYAIGNITYALVILQAIGFTIVLTHPELAKQLVLDRRALFDGEWWRLVTWLLSPVSTSPLWVVFSLYWLFTMGRALEEQWGSFRYELFWIIGILATIAAVLVGGSRATVLPLITSLLLAFATLWPNYIIRVFFLIPIPVKWLALLAGLGLTAELGFSNGLDRLVPFAALVNYLLFFGETLRDLVVGFVKEGGRARARNHFRTSAQAGADERKRVRTCAICGARNDDPKVELRVCSCEKCGGVDRDLCLFHVQNH
jgi:membrane associated rhomboid family serine protease